MLAGFALLDEVAARLDRGRLFLAALGVAVLLKCLLQWAQVRLVYDEPGALEVAAFDRHLGDSGAVYVDRFSLIPFMASQQRHAWSARPERAALTESVVRLAAGEDLRVERLILDGPHVYARLRPAAGAGE